MSFNRKVSLCILPNLAKACHIQFFRFSGCTVFVPKKHKFGKKTMLLGHKISKTNLQNIICQLETMHIALQKNCFFCSTLHFC